MTPEPDSSGDSTSKRERLEEISGRLYNHQGLMSADYFAGEVRWLISELEAAHEALREIVQCVNKLSEGHYVQPYKPVIIASDALKGWD